MGKTKVGTKAEVPPGKMVGVDVQGKKYVLANVDGSFYAIDGVCTHADGHLWEGTFNNGVVKCPRHGSEYDVNTGKVLKGPWIPFGKAHDLETYPIIVEGEDIFLDLP